MKPSVKTSRAAAFLLVLAVALWMSPQQARSETISATIDFSNYELGEETVDGTTYITFTYPDVDYTETPGAPRMPVKYVRFAVPYNACDFEVESSAGGTVKLVTEHRIIPAQEPVPASQTSELEFTLPDEQVYSSTSLWPESTVSIENRGFLYGYNQIVTVAVAPAQCIPGGNVIMASRSVTVKLTYSTTPGARKKSALLSGKELAPRLAPRSQADIDWQAEDVKGMVINPELVDSLKIQVDSAVLSIGKLSGDVYCIITNRALKQSLQRLAGWKRQKGYDVIITCMEDILSMPEVQNGDEVSGINDDAGKLRQYLANLYDTRFVKFVLLAGDSAVVPIRYCNGRNGKPKHYQNIPSDLYFAEYNGNWNLNGNKYYGEPNDKIDYYPEVFIGRILCSTPEDVANYTEKLIRYELNPGNGDYSYLDNAIYTQEKDMDDGNEAVILSQLTADIFPDSKVITENKDNERIPTGAQVVAEMNSNRYAFSSFNGHGSPEGVGINYVIPDETVYGISALDNQRVFLLEEANNGLDNLTNYYYPMISYSMSCTLMPYDQFVIDDYGGKMDVYNIKWNFGRVFTCGGLYGGPAFLGDTRTSWIKPNFNLETDFIEIIKSGTFCLGKAEAISKVNADKAEYHWLNIVHNLLGCPEFEMWTGIPAEYINLITFQSPNYVAIRGNELPNSTIAYRKKEFGSLLLQTIPRSTSITATNLYSINISDVDMNHPITVYKHNCIPYILPLFLQNATVNYDDSFQASSVKMGNSVTILRDSGDYVIGNGGSLIIEASGDVEINSGTIIDTGGRLTIKSDGKITINGGTVKKGGKLKICAKEIEINKGFSVESGGAFKTLRYDRMTNHFMFND